MTGPYDEIGDGYAAVRRPDPRIAAAIERALGDAVSVVNVGAGVGSYESRKVVAVEPSETMARQRPYDAAPVIAGGAEALPLFDRSVDAATAFLTVHHWRDRARGLSELRRVARGPVVVLTYLMDEPIPELSRWISRVYFPSIERVDREIFPGRDVFERTLGAVHVERVLVPHDCTDGFLHAYWRRPESYLEPRVQAGISGLRLLPEAELEQGLARLSSDLASGAWEERFGELRREHEIDVGLRLIVAA